MITVFVSVLAAGHAAGIPALQAVPQPERHQAFQRGAEGTQRRSPAGLREEGQGGGQNPGQEEGARAADPGAGRHRERHARKGWCEK